MMPRLILFSLCLGVLVVFLSVFGLEGVLGGSADRADPVIGQGFETGTGLYPIVGIPDGRIVLVTADGAGVLLHFASFGTWHAMSLLLVNDSLMIL